MGDYFPRITRRQQNILYTADGGVYINYILTGANLDPYDVVRAIGAQNANADLFAGLASLDTSDIFIGNFLVKEAPQTVMNRIVSGVPDFQDGKYSELQRHLEAFYRRLESGEITEYDRINWVAVRMPSRVSMFDRLSSLVFEKDPHKDVTDESIREFRDKVRQAIPDTFKPVPTWPEMIDWVFQRAITRGNPDTPTRPVPGRTAVAPGNKGFPEVILDNHADIEALLDLGVKKIAAYGVDDAAKSKTAFRRNYPALRDATVMSVTQPGERTPDFPGGLTSYQAMMAVTGYPTRLDWGINKFTALVDSRTGLDADFVIRITPDESIMDPAKQSTTLANLDAEYRANAHDEIGDTDYSSRRNEIIKFARDTQNHSADVGFRVAVIFAFGGSNLDQVSVRAAAIRRQFARSGFRVSHIPGSQTELWKLMLPGSPATGLLNDLQQGTTSRLFGAYAPLRRNDLGDGVGIPFAINIENALGRIVHMDLLHGTDRGNASVAFTGAQGSGKSYGMKLLVAWMNDLNRYSYILDMQGEWAVYIPNFASHAVIDMAAPSVSMDVFKIYPGPSASRMFTSLFVPLFGIPADGAAASYLARVAQPDYRSVRRITTTRQLLQHILDEKNFDAAEIVPQIKTLLSDPLTAAFIDPEIEGRVIDIPPFDVTARNVVFLTKDLRLPTQGVPVDNLPWEERYTIMVNTAVARLTAFRFATISGPCCFVGDEMSFYEGLGVLSDLIKTPDRTGRKFGNFVIAGSQLADEMNTEEYALIRKRFAMRQEKERNSVAALEWADFPPTSDLTNEHMTDTSPLDPDQNNMPMKGREGEGYYNDGTRRARIKIISGSVGDRERLADTTSSRMIRHGAVEEV